MFWSPAVAGSADFRWWLPSKASVRPRVWVLGTAVRRGGFESKTLQPSKRSRERRRALGQRAALLFGVSPFNVREDIPRGSWWFSRGGTLCRIQGTPERVSLSRQDMLHILLPIWREGGGCQKKKGCSLHPGALRGVPQRASDLDISCGEGQTNGTGIPFCGVWPSCWVDYHESTARGPFQALHMDLFLIWPFWEDPTKKWTRQYQSRTPPPSDPKKGIRCGESFSVDLPPKEKDESCSFWVFH